MQNTNSLRLMQDVLSGLFNGFQDTLEHIHEFHKDSQTFCVMIFRVPHCTWSKRPAQQMWHCIFVIYSHNTTWCQRCKWKDLTPQHTWSHLWQSDFGATHRQDSFGFQKGSPACLQPLGPSFATSHHFNRTSPNFRCFCQPPEMQEKVFWTPNGGLKQPFWIKKKEDQGILIVRQEFLFFLVVTTGCLSFLLWDSVSYSLVVRQGCLFFSCDTNVSSCKTDAQPSYHHPCCLGPRLLQSKICGEEDTDADMSGPPVGARLASHVTNRFRTPTRAEEIKKLFGGKHSFRWLLDVNSTIFRIL